VYSLSVQPAKLETRLAEILDLTPNNQQNSTKKKSRQNNSRQNKTTCDNLRSNKVVHTNHPARIVIPNAERLWFEQNPGRLRKQESDGQGDRGMNTVSLYLEITLSLVVEG